jgi:ABC-2 type transport system permease protein
MAPIRALSMALAGTDFAHHRDFVTAAEDYRRAIQRVMNDDISRNSRPGVVYTAGPDLWAQVPEFTYRLPDVWWALGRNQISLVMLAGWLVVALWFASRAAQRLAAE